MSTRVLVAASAVALAALGTWPGTALANRLAMVVSGTVTAVPIGSTITVNGHTYTIAHGSLAARQVQAIVSGEKVRITLMGPANSHAAKVVAIHARATR